MTYGIRAAGYARVSTDEQARDGYGLDAQRSAITSYCAAQRWELVEIFVDAGVSGKSTRGRTELLRMLEAADQAEFDRISVLEA